MLVRVRCGPHQGVVVQSGVQPQLGKRLVPRLGEEERAGALEELVLLAVRVAPGTRWGTGRCAAPASAASSSTSHRGSRLPAPTSKCPCSVASVTVSSSHGQLRSRAHFNTSRCPFKAAFAQLSSRPTGNPAPTPTSKPQGARAERRSDNVSSFHGHPFALAQASCSMDPK